MFCTKRFFLYVSVKCPFSVPVEASLKRATLNLSHPFCDLLVPEVVIEAFPGGELAPRIDEHGRRRGTILRQLAVGGVWAHQRELDWMQRIRSQDLMVESSVDHGCFRSVGAHQVH